MNKNSFDSEDSISEGTYWVILEIWGLAVAVPRLSPRRIVFYRVVMLRCYKIVDFIEQIATRDM